MGMIGDEHGIKTNIFVENLEEDDMKQYKVNDELIIWGTKIFLESKNYSIFEKMFMFR